MRCRTLPAAPQLSSAPPMPRPPHDTPNGNPMFDKRPRKTFRQLFGEKQVFTPCVWDCYSAKAAEMAGFEAILLSGASLGFSMSGVPDMGLHNQEELVWATDRI